MICTSHQFVIWVGRFEHLLSIVRSRVLLEPFCHHHYRALLRHHDEVKFAPRYLAGLHLFGPILSLHLAVLGPRLRPFFQLLVCHANKNLLWPKTAIHNRFLSSTALYFTTEQHTRQQKKSFPVHR